MSETPAPYAAVHSFGRPQANGVALVHPRADRAARVSPPATQPGARYLWLDDLDQIDWDPQVPLAVPPPAPRPAAGAGATGADRPSHPPPALATASRDLIAVGEALLDQLCRDLYGKSALHLLLPHFAAWRRASDALRHALAATEDRP